MARLRLATTWLGGCSGCHMSFLDMDEWLIELAACADIVYSPILDVKEFPLDVDVVLVEGAVANADHDRHLRLIRERSQVLIAFGDCAVTGNVTACRNAAGGKEGALKRAYEELATINPGVPTAPGVLPELLERVLPLHHVHGIINVVCSALWSGAVCEVLPRFDAETTWDRRASALAIHSSPVSGSMRNSVPQAAKQIPHL